jgi:hypothetical protein
VGVSEALLTNDPKSNDQETAKAETWAYIREKLAELASIAETSHLPDLADRIQQVAALDSPDDTSKPPN